MMQALSGSIGTATGTGITGVIGKATAKGAVLLAGQSAVGPAGDFT